MNKQSGFTLIELVMVIVILGVLAVTALPKFIDLKGDARQAAIASVAGSLSSAAAMNYAARKANVNNGVAVATCAAVAGAMQGAALPAPYTFTNGTDAVGPDLSVTTCSIQDASSSPTVTATFTAIGIL